MRIAYVTSFNAKNLDARHNWSGSGYYIAQALERQSMHLDYIGPLEIGLAIKLSIKFKSGYHKIWRKKYLKDSEPLLLKSYARQISEKLSNTKSDVVFSASSNIIAYLKCSKPIVFWGDATFAGLMNFYPQYTNGSQESVKNWHLLERLALNKCKLAIYASEWAAQTAIQHYGANPDIVKVVPFGANIDDCNTLDEIKNLIDSRPSSQCKLLFLGVDWYRKGGDVALKVAEKLNKIGLHTELTVVGCQPIGKNNLPGFVKCIGFIDKSKSAGKNRINQLISESHFLILPSKAECYGVVFCEANALGVPCITTNVGGIPTIIKDNVNGKLFDKSEDHIKYCEFILRNFANYTQYKKLALSAFNEYKLRLNWNVAGQKVKALLLDI